MLRSTAAVLRDGASRLLRMRQLCVSKHAGMTKTTYPDIHTLWIRIIEGVYIHLYPIDEHAFGRHDFDTLVSPARSNPGSIPQLSAAVRFLTETAP